MKQLLGLISAAVGAAATMYYFDPESGARRRAKLTARVLGFQADAGHPAWDGKSDPVSPADGKLRERVIEQINQLVSHPGHIHVEVKDRTVRLSGRVLAPEMHGLLTHVRDMPGVRRVINALSARETLHDRAQAASEDELEAEVQAHPS